VTGDFGLHSNDLAERHALARNKTSAFILSSIAVISFSITSAFLNILLPSLLTGQAVALVSNTLRPIQAGDILALIAVLLATLLLLIGIGAFWIYRFFGEAYYGKRGAVRWALFGVFFALALELVDWITPEGWQLLKILLEIAGLLGAFFGARKVVPLARRTFFTRHR
jgi:hypothetical protein